MTIFANANLHNSEGLLDLAENIGINPNRATTLDPKPIGKVILFRSHERDFIKVFKEYANSHGEKLIRDFESLWKYHFEGIFEDEEGYFEAMSSSGSFEFINKNDRRLGCFFVKNFEEIRFYLDIDTEKFINNIDKYLIDSVKRFSPIFKEYIKNYADDLAWTDSHEIFVEQIDRAGLECSDECCDYLHEIIHLFENGLRRNNREYHVIISSRDPFHFSLGEGLYDLHIISHIQESCNWEIIEFICDV